MEPEPWYEPILHWAWFGGTFVAGLIFENWVTLLMGAALWRSL